MPRLVDPTTTVWTEEERVAALDVLAKIALCEKEGMRLENIHEARTRGAVKNISTEAVCFNEKDSSVYLIERPSLEENPDEAYPHAKHSPGVTHGALETDEMALERLIAREFGGVKPNEVRFIGKENATDPPRGLYLLLIHVLIFKWGAEPKNLKGRFYRREEIPWDELIQSHKNIILPKALKWWDEHQRFIEEIERYHKDHIGR